ncbi:uncharacterized protein LOC100368484 [Saccoglossus kowalevskii]|uniref:Uncharacterized protein LOC100368484 n=1 Tax=Saccoglossus kowalevskii TaxID=10224 RepID=A0ABM0GU57_SACKO|nr:PREDICTED: uncharacterized protein LOC100368484 [Saccoglossus kowalevskii]
MSNANIKSALGEQMKKFTEYYDSGDFENLKELFTEDCKMMAPGKEVQYGREDTIAVLQGMKSDGVETMTFEFEEVGNISGDEFVFDRSKYTMFKSDGSVIVVGKYLAIWKKVADKYCLYTPCFNMNVK